MKLIANKREEWTEYKPPSQICSKNRSGDVAQSANTKDNINNIFWTRKVLEAKLFLAINAAIILNEGNHDTMT